MAHTTDQIEKHTIVARLSVSIYQMDDEQLINIMNLLENNGSATEEGRENDALFRQAKDPYMRRQMILARLFVLINQLDKDELLQRLRTFQHPDFRWIREYPRLACYLMVDFATDGKAYRSCIRDISASGVFIETADRFKEGQAISLCFSLAEADKMMPFKVKGKVARIYPDGIGVQYQNVTEYQRDIISALLDKIK